MKLLHILGIVLFAQVATASPSLFGSLLSAAQDVISDASVVAEAVVDEASTIVGSVISLSEAAVQNLGGTAIDLFGSLTTLIQAVPNATMGFASVDLSASEFLLTGQDPFFNASRDVFFVLYTNENPNGVNVTAATIASTTYNSSNPTRIVIHGYLNNHLSVMNIEIRQQYLALGNFNVIIVDWGYGAFDISYLNARLRVNSVSIQVAGLINTMISNNLTTYNQTVVVGHSLGGQTAGLTGKKIVGGKIRAVIALDPAGPLFPIQPSTSTVQPTDAQYVEAIHCNGGGFGMLEPCAQADFFPNWGTLQPGCADALVCPHLRCYDLFAESIAKTDRFVATKCASYSEITKTTCTNQGGSYVMGGEAPNSGISGIFYLATAGASPFALGG